MRRMVSWFLLSGLSSILGIVIVWEKSPVFYLTVFVVVLVASSLIAHRKILSADLFSPMFVTSVIMVNYSFAGAIFHLRGAYPESTLILASFYFLVFVASYLLGLSLHMGDVMASRLPRLRSSFSIQRLRILSLFFPLGGFGLFYYMMYRAGLRSLSDILNNLLLFRESWGREGAEYLMIGSRFLIEAPFWVWIIKGNLSIWGSIVAGLYWLLILLVGLLTGTRGNVYSAMIGLAFVYNCSRRRISISRTLVVGGFLLIPFSTFYLLQGTLRGQQITTADTVKAAQEMDLPQAVEAMVMRFSDAFEGFVKIINESNRLNILWGRSFYDALFLPIPRAWMPDKPYSFNTQMRDELFPEFQGKFYGEEYSLPGEMYMNFHVAGIIIGGWIFGVLIKTAQRYYAANQANSSFVFLYRPLVMVPMAYLTSGLINSSAHQSFAILLLGVVFLKVLRPRSVGQAREVSIRR